MFILYFIGHWLKNISKSLIITENITDNDNRSLDEIQDDINVDYVIDLRINEAMGETIQISSEYGIRKLSVIDIRYCVSSDNYIEKSEIYSLKNIPANKTVYMQRDLGEFIRNTLLRIERYDYTIIDCTLCISGRNGHIHCEYSKPRHNLKSILYYMSA